jgi:hypothetical protein
MLLPSSLFLSFAMRTDRSLTARLDEHRLSKNTIGPVCAFGEQRETDSPRRHVRGVVEPKLGARRHRPASTPPFYPVICFWNLAAQSGLQKQ